MTDEHIGQLWNAVLDMTRRLEADPAVRVNLQDIVVYLEERNPWQAADGSKFMRPESEGGDETRNHS